MIVKCPNCSCEGEIDDNATGNVACPDCGFLINLEDVREQTLNKNYLGAVLFIIVALFVIPALLWWFGKLGFFKSLLCYAIGMYIWCCAYKKLERDEEMINRRRGL